MPPLPRRTHILRYPSQPLWSSKPQSTADRAEIPNGDATDKKLIRVAFFCSFSLSERRDPFSCRRETPLFFFWCGVPPPGRNLFFLFSSRKEKRRPRVLHVVAIAEQSCQMSGLCQPFSSERCPSRAWIFVSARCAPPPQRKGIAHCFFGVVHVLAGHLGRISVFVSIFGGARSIRPLFPTPCGSLLV